MVVVGLLGTVLIILSPLITEGQAFLRALPEQVDRLQGVLKDNPQITLEIQGHTDNVGQGAYNLKLSQSRADSVRQYLISKGGVSAGRRESSTIE